MNGAPHVLRQEAEPMNETGETEPQRKARAEKLAYEKGAKDQSIQSRFERNEAHLFDINGDLKRINVCLDEVVKRLSSIENKETTRDAVAESTQAAVARHGQNQITTRQFYLGIASILVAVVALYLGAS